MSKEFLHNIIKNELSELGYLPNLPYHLISDSEMFDAFLSVQESATRDIDMSKDIDSYDTAIRKAANNPAGLGYVVSGCMFYDYYPIDGYDFQLNNTLTQATDMSIERISSKTCYSQLVQRIHYCIESYKLGEEIPDWVYAYMLRAVIGPKSSYDDICSLQSMLGLTVTGEFSIETAKSCLLISRESAKSYDGPARPVDLYTKYIRVNRANDGAEGLTISEKVSKQVSNSDCPITMFGDLNVIKYLRKSRNVTQNVTQNVTRRPLSLLQ